jgi:hypothetical protein
VEHVFCGVPRGLVLAMARAPVPLPLEVTGAAPIHPLEFVSIQREVCDCNESTNVRCFRVLGRSHFDTRIFVASSFQETFHFQFARMDKLRGEWRELLSWTRTREEHSREVANRLTSKVCANGFELDRH